MPIYAFRCEACGHRFDRLQKLSDADPRECPECGAAAIKRQVTAPAFRLAGSGWYETDFKSNKDKQRNLAGKDEAPSASGDKKEPADKSADKSATTAPETTAAKGKSEKSSGQAKPPPSADG